MVGREESRKVSITGRGDDTTLEGRGAHEARLVGRRQTAASCQRTVDSTTAALTVSQGAAGPTVQRTTAPERAPPP